MKVTTAILFAVSPTYVLADIQKRGLDGAARARLIRRRNVSYLAAGIVLAVATAVLTRQGTGAPPWGIWWPILVPIAWYLQSRCHEVFMAFYRDAFDKLSPDRQPSSTLAWSTRVRLALNSYAELILDFSVMYAMLPVTMWQCTAPRPGTFIDLLTYSALTITTSGGGDFLPRHWLLQLLSTYEVFCGLMLLVVSFTIYRGAPCPKGANAAQADPDLRDFERRLVDVRLPLRAASVTAKQANDACRMTLCPVRGAA